MKVRTIHQTVRLPGTPEKIYAALVDAKKHATFSGAPARLVAKPGGAFSHYGGALEGYVLVLEKNRHIVLAWRANSWPTAHYSIADFVLTKVKGGTCLEFTQSGVPTSAYAAIVDGWRKHYWTRLEKFLA